MRAFDAGGDRLQFCMESSSEGEVQDVGSSSSHDPPSSSDNHGGRGDDSYSSYEEDVEDVKLPRGRTYS